MENPLPGMDADSYSDGYRGHGPSPTGDHFSYQAGVDQRAREDPAWAAAHPSALQGQMGGGIKLLLCLPFIVLAMGILYPLTVAAAVGVSMAVWGVGHRFVPRSWDLAALFMAGSIGLIAFWLISRVEHRVSRYRGFRYARHLLRMAILAVIATFVVLGFDRQIFSWSFSEILHALWATPSRLALLVVALLVAHVALVYLKDPRDSWHGTLEQWGLRPANASSPIA